MIESISLKNFTLLSNFVMVKPDTAYDIVVLQGPKGTKIELKLISEGEQEANHYSISGTVVKRPEKLFFFNKNSYEAQGMSHLEFASSMKASTSSKCNHPYQEGDKIYYNYNVQFSCEQENRLLQCDEHGIVMLVPAESIFGYVHDGEIIPVNGYVFFERDKELSEYETESGLTVIRTIKGYEMNSATVISSSSPVEAYLDGGIITNESYEKGDRIIIDKRFGYKMAYDLHAAELKNVEIVFQKHILAKLEKELA